MVFTAIVVLVLNAGGEAAAQPPDSDEADGLPNPTLSKLQPTTIIVSGGVSLGSYQAGLLHVYTQYLLKRRDQVARLAPDLLAEPVTATGASAGSLNAFLAAISICRKPVVRPEDSLFWRLWLPVGLEGLIETEEVTTYSLLSRRPLDHGVQLVKDTWNDELWNSEPCRINLGMSVTREVPRSIALNTDTARDEGNVSLPIQSERVVLVMEGEGGGAPGIKSWNPPAGSQDTDFFVDFDIRSPPGGQFPDGLVKLLQASSAFPLAWPPVLVQMRGEPSYGYFLDGGVFDNNPVHLATRLLYLSEARGDGHFNKGIALSHLKRKIPSRLLYVEPDATPWQDELLAEVQRRDSFLTMYSQLALSLIGTARKAELVSTLDYDHSLRDRIDVPQRSWPITGAFMLNFFAFLEEDFRRFDFYSGMADAWEFLQASDERSGMRIGLSDVKIDSPEFFCVLQFRKSGGDRKAIEVEKCKALVEGAQKNPERARNLLALLDTSALMRTAIKECIAVKSCVPGVEFDVFSAQLTKNGYTFRDRSLQKESVIGAVRGRIHPLVAAFASKQPFPDSAVVAVVGKAALDSIDVRPSTWFVGLGMLSRSGLEVEYSRRMLGPWRPFTLGSRLMRVQTRFLESAGDVAEERNSMTLDAYWHPLSIEFNPVRPWWWFRTAASAGVAVETTLLGFRPATLRFPVEVSVTVLFLQRVYLRAIYKNYALDACPHGRCNILTAEAAADPSQVAGVRADLTMAIGFRFID